MWTLKPRMLFSAAQSLASSTCMESGYCVHMIKKKNLNFSLQAQKKN